MKTHLKILLAAMAMLLSSMFLASHAATQPICPTYNLNFSLDKVAPQIIDAYHGEMLDIRCNIDLGNYDGDTSSVRRWRFYWQEVGMGDNFWEKEVSDYASGIIARIFFEPNMDTGAKVYNCFVGEPGANYRAAFQIRMRPSPGAEPAVLPLPVKTLDFAKVKVENAPYYTKDEADAATDAAIVSKVTKEYVEGLGITGGGIVEVDTTLSQSGMAADAAAVGNRFTGVNESFTAIWKDVNLCKEVALDHAAKTDNPHGVTLEQIGASAVIEPRQASWYLSEPTAGLVSNVYGVRAPISDFIGSDSALDIRRVAVKFTQHDTNTKLKLVVINNDAVVSTFDSDSTQTRKDDSDEEVWHFTNCKIPASSVSGNSFLQLHFKTTSGTAKTRQIWVRSSVAKYALTKNQSESPTVGWTGTLSPAIRLWAVARETEGGGDSSEIIKAQVAANLAGTVAASALDMASQASEDVSELKAWALGNDVAVKVEHATEPSATFSVLHNGETQYSSDSEAAATVARANEYTDNHLATLAGVVDEKLEEKADRAWGKYTSGGAPANGDTLIVEKKSLAITGGGNFTYIDAGEGGYYVATVSLGNKWTIESLADAQNPDNPTTLTWKDSDGNAIQTITSTSSREVYCVAGVDMMAPSVDHSGSDDVVTLPFPVVSSEAPKVFYVPNLDNYGDDDFAEATPDNWPDYIKSVPPPTGASGNWRVSIVMNGKPRAGFFKGKFIKDGTVYTRFDKPIGIAHVVVEGISYSVKVETVNGKKLLVLTED